MALAVCGPPSPRLARPGSKPVEPAANATRPAAPALPANTAAGANTWIVRLQLKDRFRTLSHDSTAWGTFVSWFLTDIASALEAKPERCVRLACLRACSPRRMRARMLRSITLRQRARDTLTEILIAPSFGDTAAVRSLPAEPGRRRGVP